MNASLTLRKVMPSDLDAVREYREEFLVHGDTMDGCSNLRRFENMTEWYDWICRAEHPSTCPAGWVPDTQYLCVRNWDGRIVGMLDIRHELNEACFHLFGNIGYSVRHSERRKGYATAMLSLAKDICRSMGMQEILISCHKKNTASAQTILHNGGILENEVVDHRNGEVLQRYWIPL
nr:GNAT family N-acetyltransferase [Oscillospiraceae bacterium]